jgi:hypothetical protein
MPASKDLRRIVLAVVLLGSSAIAQRPDAVTANRALTPQWKQLSRAAGMIFAGTVLRVEALPASNFHSIPTVEVTFHIDQAIVGVEPGEVLVVREWAGAWSNHRPMQIGQRQLLFLYPPSVLGLTSPVGGPAGLFPLDAQGRIATPPAVTLPPGHHPLPPVRSPVPRTTTGASIRQLAQSIRRAREE